MARQFALKIEEERVSFFPEDPSLESLLSKFRLKKLSFSSVEGLNEALSRILKLRDAKVPVFYEENKTPLGEAIIRYGPVCKHIAALQYSILLLCGADCTMVATPKKTALKLQESHCFNQLNLNGVPNLLDAVNNWFFPFSELKHQARLRAKTTKYHSGAEPVDSVFNYDDNL